MTQNRSLCGVCKSFMSDKLGNANEHNIANQHNIDREK